MNRLNPLSKLTALSILTILSNSFINIDSVKAANLKGTVSGTFTLITDTEVPLINQAIYTFDKITGDGIFRVLGENFTITNGVKIENGRDFNLTFNILNSHDPNMIGLFVGTTGNDNIGRGTLPFSINNGGTPSVNLINYLALNVSAKHVPEPVTILGVGTAIAFGTTFKLKLAKAKKR